MKANNQHIKDLYKFYNKIIFSNAPIQPDNWTPAEDSDIEAAMDGLDDDTDKENNPLVNPGATVDAANIVPDDSAGTDMNVNVAVASEPVQGSSRRGQRKHTTTKNPKPKTTRLSAKAKGKKKAVDSGPGTNFEDLTDEGDLEDD
jgi:hypothetical protein